MPVVDPIPAIPAITLWQPWATLLARGLKVYETRSWCPPDSMNGQRIAIHAGTRHRIAFDVSPDLQKRVWNMGITIDDLPRGAIVGTARLVAVHKTEDRRRLVSGAELDFGDWSPGRFAWEMEDPVEFAEPIPWRGAQKVWEWAPERGTCLVCGAADDRCPGGVWADDSRRLCSESECRRLALAGGMIQ